MLRFNNKIHGYSLILILIFLLLPYGGVTQDAATPTCKGLGGNSEEDLKKLWYPKYYLGMLLLSTWSIGLLFLFCVPFCLFCKLLQSLCSQDIPSCFPDQEIFSWSQLPFKWVSIQICQLVRVIIHLSSLSSNLQLIAYAITLSSSLYSTWGHSDSFLS